TLMLLYSQQHTPLSPLHSFPTRRSSDLEPEVEDIARENEVIPGLGDLIQERVERLPHGGRHLTQVRVRHHDDARGFTLGRHGPSLGTWIDARKHITVLP